MNEERNKILGMLADGKISVADAERLLDAISKLENNTEAANEQITKPRPKYLYIKVEGGDDSVNVRVPIQLLYAGMQFSPLIPKQAKKKVEHELENKGIHFDFSNIKPEMVDEMVKAFADLEVNVQEKNGESVKIFCQ